LKLTINSRDAVIADVMRLDELPAMSANDFIETLGEIPWFVNLGNSSAAHSIDSWEEWPGPEDFNVEALHLQQQAWFDSFCDKGGKLPGGLQVVWDETNDTVLAEARNAVPFQDDKDPWHAPNMAVGQAAFTAGLVALFIAADRPQPYPLQQQWHLLTLGHWPCGYFDAEATPLQLVVY